MKNCVEYTECIFGACTAVSAAVPINAKLHPSEFKYIIENSDRSLYCDGRSRR